MMRRPLVLVVLSLVTFTLAACSDVTGPTPSEPRVTTVTSGTSGATSGGYGTSTGKK